MVQVSRGSTALPHNRQGSHRYPICSRGGTEECGCHWHELSSGHYCGGWGLVVQVSRGPLHCPRISKALKGTIFDPEGLQKSRT